MGAKLRPGATARSAEEAEDVIKAEGKFVRAHELSSGEVEGYSKSTVLVLITFWRFS